MESIMNLWVAEYSAQQQAFNVDSLGRALKTNAMLIQNREGLDYLPFGIFRTIEEADAACDAMRQLQENLKESKQCQNQHT
jgi:hypothetical protein